MYLRIADIVINTNQLVHARVSGGSEARRDREVVLVMTKGPEIELVGESAEKFLAALPVYEPVTGED